MKIISGIMKDRGNDGSRARSAPRLVISVVTVMFLGILLVHLVFHRKFSMVVGSSGMVDIDIGTSGVPMKSNADILITFDPGDEPIKEPNLERYKFVISDRSGPVKFYMNEGIPGCSSLNRRNEFYNMTMHEKGMWGRCRIDEAAFRNSYLWTCMHSPLREVRVHSMLLSSFMKQRRIKHVGTLKIDAQGSDFAILKDIVEHSPEITYDLIIVKCQQYNGGTPLYFADNDCEDIKAYMEEHFTSLEIVKHDVSCMAFEENLEFRNINMPSRLRDAEPWREMLWSNSK